MSDSNENQVVSDDLDEFSNMLFQQGKPEPAKDDSEDDALAPNELTDDAESEGASGSDADPEPTPEPEEEPKAKKEKPKTRFQERIDELTKQREDVKRAADQRISDLETRLNEAIAKLEGKKTPPRTERFDGPQPDEKTEAGEDKYPLGEFDPAYIRDVTRHTIAAELAKKQAEEQEQRKAAELKEATATLQKEWQVKVEKSIDKYPDLLEKEDELAVAFSDVDASYGTYLASTIMSLDYGPDVLYYLANNVDEARQIVQSGPARATIALGRLEARFALQDEDNRQEKKLKVSKAPQPPERLNKGTIVAREVPDDTDDLDAFAQKLFNRKRRW